MNTGLKEKRNTYEYGGDEKVKLELYITWRSLIT